MTSAGAPAPGARAAAAPRFAIVVSRADDWPDARELALAAHAAGADVGVFAMDTAVAALAADAAGRRRLADADCDVIACGTSAHQAHLSAAAVGVPLGSQDDHAALVHRAHHLVAFT